MDSQGLTENDGHENDGPSTLQDMKLTDQFAGRKHKIARRYENAVEDIAQQK